MVYDTPNNTLKLKKSINYYTLPTWQRAEFQIAVDSCHQAHNSWGYIICDCCIVQALLFRISTIEQELFDVVVEPLKVHRHRANCFYFNFEFIVHPRLTVELIVFYRRSKVIASKFPSRRLEKSKIYQKSKCKPFSK